MTRSLRQKIKNLLTGNWLIFLFFLVSPFTVFSQEVDTVQTQALTVDTLKNDSLQAKFSDDLKSSVHYPAADSIVFDVDSNKVYLFKKARVEYEDITLEADYIEVNWDTKILYATGFPDSSGKMSGFPVFKQKADELKAKTIRYNYDTKKGKVTDIFTKQGDGYLHGSLVKKIDNTEFVRYGKYTTCDLDTPHYYIGSNKIKVIQNNKIITGPAYLDIGGVPTPLIVPFGYFPNKRERSSGILFPTYGESSRLGFFLKNGGYYIGASDYFDLALTGDIYTQGSWGTQFHSNYANRYHFRGQLDVSYSVIKESEPELPDYSVSRDFFIRWSHSQDPKANPNSQFSANVNAGSSNYYQKNVSTSYTNFLTNTFSSSIAYSRNFPGKPYNLTASLNHSQNTITHDINLTVPNVSFGVSTLHPFQKKTQVGLPSWYEKTGISYSGNFQNLIQTKDSLLFKKEALDKFKNGLSHTIPISTSLKVLKYFTFSPSITFNDKMYLQSITKRWTGDSLITDTLRGFKNSFDWIASTSLNTRIYGMFQFKNSKVVAIRHVITPNLSFSYRPDFGKEKYGYYKTVQSNSTGETQQYSIFQNGIFGGPPSGKYGFIGFGFDNNIEMKVRSASDTVSGMKKIKIFESLSLNSGYNLALDSLNLSDIAISARTTLFDKVNLNANASLDPYILDPSGTYNINKFELNENGRIGRLTYTNISCSFSINNQKKNKESNKGTQDQLDQVNRNPDNYVDFTVPFNLNVNYNLSYSKPTKADATVNQTVGFNGDIALTEKWKITFSSGYDFQQEDWSPTSLGFYRDLHCWEMHLNWIPFGYLQGYFFQINVKSSVLQDLKMIKKNDVYDR